ncbi:MAG: rhomboid family intramembrane serine protease [Mycobacteriaceae bacterium]|nr:rhomboid family intramembrane serine protease [Mycobacteriaceae bacterium]NBQ42522.1 rhomboid family intramembrane serine protease [Mycobacteriaceae bacterium]
MSTPYPPPAPYCCYRHPDRGTYLGCTHCGRPACPECLRSAPVGQQCVDCVHTAAAQAPVVSAPMAVVRRTGQPLITYALIAVNVAVFIAQTASPGLERTLSLWPPAVAAGDYYRLVTSAFMHYGLVHIAFNMWALYVLGPPLEQHLGRMRFAGLYGLSALGGSVVVYLFSPLNAATAGASGAIFGLFGATFVAAKRLNLDVRWLVTLIAINLVLTFTVPGISWQGHLGGLLTGMLVALIYLYVPRAAAQAGLSVAFLVVLVTLIFWRTGAILDQFGAMHGG